MPPEPTDDNHGLKGVWALVGNAGAMTLVAVGLIYVYLDMKSFLVGEIEYQRQNVAAWHENVTQQHRDIIGGISSLDNKLSNLSRDLHRAGVASPAMNKDKP